MGNTFFNIKLFNMLKTPTQTLYTPFKNINIPSHLPCNKWLDIVIFVIPKFIIQSIGESKNMCKLM